MSISLSSNCQTDTSKVLVSAELIRNISKELAEYDGMKEQFEAQKIIIKGYQLDLIACENKALVLEEGQKDCEFVQGQKDAMIEEQDDKIKNVRNQRNIAGGIALALLVVLVLR